MDYQKCWMELKENIYNFRKDINSGTNNCIRNAVLESHSVGISFTINLIDALESKYQSKQYTWSEVLSMSPLPPFIKSYSGLPYDIRTMSGEYLQTTDNLKHYIYYYGNGIPPSIQEMQNKWTIIVK